MSASKDKEHRKNQREQGIDLRTAEEIKKEKKKKRQRLALIGLGIVFAVFILFVLISNTGFFYSNATAVTIEDDNYSITEYNYFYYNAYYSYMSSGYGYMYIDTSVPLTSQAYSLGDDENYTWADYFRDAALENMQTMTTLLIQAEADGVTELDEKYQQTLAEDVEALATDAEEAGYSSVNSHLTAYYGKGMTEKVMERILQRVLLAQQYSEQIQDEFTESYTDEELEEHYVENQDEFDRYTYRYYLAYSTEDEDEGIDAETGMAEAEEIANAIADGTESEDDFIQLVYEYGGDSYEDEDSTLSEDISGSSLVEAYSEWMMASERQEGDVTVAESDSGYYVLYYIGRDGNELELMGARHILIMPEEVEEDDDMTDDEITELEDAALEEAFAEAEDVYTQWQEGDADEDSFAALAKEYTEDTASTADGGLYEKIYPGEMQDEFNDWVFDSSRKYGDTEIIQTSYGYHIMFFVGDAGQSYRQYLAEQSMLEDDYTAWEEEITESVSVKTKFFIRFGAV